MSAARPTIFVSIASYRDSECQWTLKDLFAKAEHPERVFVGLCDQFVPGEDDDCFVEPCPRPDQVRRLDIHARDSKGACWARHKVQELWRGEDYFFQIDSHMRFAEGWDQRLIDMLAACPAKKPVLSAYPPAYEPPDQLSPASVVTILPKAFDARGVLMFRSTAAILGEEAPPLSRNPFIAAGLLFARADLIREVPYDPHLYFQGEEVTLAARLWTHGWDVFVPNAAIAWHDYTKRPGRPRHWNDSTDWGVINNRSFARLRHLLGMQASSDPDVLADIERYALGSARSLASFEAFAGISFLARLVGGRAETLPNDAPNHEDQIRRRIATFDGIWSQNGWRDPESRSGSGSTMAATASLRAKLPDILRYLGCEVLVDAGCGDLNWMQHLSDALRLYLGFDIAPGPVADLRRRFSARGSHLFEQRDIVTDALPPGDAILCRDVLTHLPPAQVVAALHRFKASGARHLFATTHPGAVNRWIDVGGWCPYDLTQAPFNLPPPRQLISEDLPGTQKSLGVWLCSDIPAG